MTESERFATLEVVLFSVGAWRVGMEAGRVRGCRWRSASDAPESADIRLMSTWMALPAAECHERPMLLETLDAGQSVTWQVQGPVTLHALPVETIHPLPPLLAARTTIPGLRALALTPEEGLILLIDPSIRAQDQERP
ncbi:MAG: hypothetical protein HQM00_14895 [Magnetococcales bacterium]|nr:hypothetical protein [Magnetococcales bacterium]